MSSITPVNPQIVNSQVETPSVTDVPWQELNNLVTNSEIFIIHWSLNTLNQDESIHYFSKNTKLFGFDPQDLVSGKLTWSDIVHPEDNQQVLQEITNAVHTRSGEYTITYRIKSFDGFKWIQENASFVTDEKENMVHFQTIIIDISKRKDAEVELEKKNLYLNSLHDTAVSLNKRLSLDEVLATILEQFELISQTTDNYVSLLNPDGSGLKIVAVSGVFQELLGSTISDKNVGVLGYVWRTHEALYIEDYQNFPEKVTKDYAKDIGAVAALPLFANGSFLGAISYHTKEKISFDDEAKTLYLRFAQLVSLALNNSQILETLNTELKKQKHLERELKERESQYKVLAEIATQKTNELSLLDELQHAISSQLELEELFDVSLKKIIEIFGYSQTYIRVLDGEHLRLVANQGFRTSRIPQSIFANHPVPRILMEQKKFFLLNKESHEKYLPKETKLFGASTMLLPIHIQSKFWGFMGIGNKTKALEQRDFDIGQKVVELMSVAIENAQLHAHVKHDLRRNESLHKISQAVQEHSNLNNLTDSIVEYVRQAMNARWATLYKIDLRKKLIESVSTTDLQNSPLKILKFNELSRGLSGWVIKNKKVASVTKGNIDERESSEFSQKIIDSKIGSIAVIPFMNNGKVEGTISVINHMDDPDFSENDLQLLNTVANQVGAAMGKYKLIRQIEHQAFHDSLTHLPNRLQFENKISSIIENAQRRKVQFAILFIDLDGFKHINDTLGHALGDQLLIAVANRIQKRKRIDDVLARMGGDEFAIVLTEVNSTKNALKIANDYLKFFTEPYVIAGYELSIGASIGVSLYPEDGQDIHTLLSNADSAMYQAKNSGKNSVSGFTPSLAEEVKERAKLERELKLAVERDELELHYQPQYTINTQELIGLEALVRWRHPQKGLISPGIFIPIAEESNLIIDIGNWVLFEACRQNAEWQAKGHQAIPVAVNISSKQFARADFVENVVKALQQSRLQSEYLELEVTESVVMNDTQAVIERLQLLRKLKINIAIDDFGTGYSSLTYLQDFPLDKLKIDKSFVDKLEETANPAIIKTILMLAQSLGLTTIAEGVETKAQLKILQDLGCDEAQGFYLAKPLAAESVWMDYVEVKNKATATLVQSK